MKKFLAFLFTIIISAGLTFVMVSGNFFMFNLIIKNQTKAIQEINEAIAGFSYSKYYDMTVYENMVDGEDEVINQTSIKFAYNENYDFNFAGHKTQKERTGSTEEVTEYDFYYVDGVLYVNNPGTEEKSKSTLSLNNALGGIFQFYNIVLLEAFNIEAEFVNEETVFSTQFVASASPLYVGLSYSFHNGTAEDVMEYEITFSLDILKAYRGISYNVRMGEANSNFSTKVFSYNKPLTLTIPTDLETYLDI